MKIAAKVLVTALILLVAFVAGRLSASENAAARSGEAIEFVQAEKVRQHLADLRQLQTYLGKGCSLSAKEKVKNEIEASLMFLAEHVRAYPRGVLATMLETREPESMEELRGQTVDWSRTFRVPECNPA